MVGGLFSAAAGMAAQQAYIDALSNDIANVNTDGYKQVRVGFRDLAYAQERGVAVGAGAAVVDGGRSFAQGVLAQTGNPLSLAIDGPGFLQVRRQDGTIALTRSGVLEVDAQGSIVTANGERLVPPLTLPKGTSPADVSIDTDGTVSINNGRTKIGQIELVDVPAHSGLLPVGGNLFATTAQSGAATAQPRALLRQGFVERSNVDVSDSMVGLVQAQRGYELQSRVIKTQDQLLEIANGIRQ